MNDLALFTETPRAGTLGHRFLVPVDLAVSEVEAAAFVQIVGDGISVGKNFVAIATRVTQQNGSGAVRTGRELIVLAGVDVLQLSGREFAQLAIFLQDSLSKLERLVVDGIDWARASTLEVIVRREELQQWIDQLKTMSLPTTEWRGGPRALTTTDAPPSQPSVQPLRSSSLHNVLLAVVACAVGIVASTSYQYLFRRPVPSTPEDTRREQPVAADPATPQKVSKSESIEHPNSDGDGIASPHAPPSNRSDGIINLLRKAVEADKVDVVVGVLSLLPWDVNTAAQDREVIIEYSSRLVRSGRYDDGSRVLQAIAKCHVAWFADSKTSARLADLQRMADEGCESLDQADRNLYEAVRSSTGRQQLEAARTYLASGPRRNMLPVVRDWLEWATKPIKAEVIGIDVPLDGALGIRIASNDYEVARKLDSVDLVSSARPLEIMMTPLGITNQLQQATVRVVVETEDMPALRAPLRLAGTLQVGKQSGADTRLKLVSAGLPQQTGTLTIRFRGFENAPILSDWTKSSP